MKSEYTTWIQENVPDHPLGLCQEITESMQHEFPELSRIRGYYHCPIWGSRAHWWLVDSERKIIDPTKTQFPSNGIGGVYEPWDESQPEPTGICPNCGDYCYDHRPLCSKECETEYIAYLNHF